ncbi:KGG domain-containing protein [Hymenobacter koreensis]|uniref:KGG domain-containing protein n=1 Tax=Hymenobacter koreensis TaxID=1084523 RepID=A0ABP8IW93_9BACT
MATTNQSSRGSMSQSENVKRTQSGTSNRGFASMDPEQQRRIAAEGGRASHLSGRGHEWTSQEAREAGRKGGQASGSRNKTQAATSGGATAQKRETGRKSGEASGGGNR